jgi:hypothetical protein
MSDYSKMSDAELMALYNQQQKQQQPASSDYNKMSDAELAQEYARQQAAAQASMQEPDPRNLPQPISSNDKVNAQAILGSVPPSLPDDRGLKYSGFTPDFIRDFRSITGNHPETLPVDQDIEGKARFAQTPKEAFDSAVANGLLKPDREDIDPHIYQNFTSKWKEYKDEMDTNMLGALARGAKTSAIPTIVGTGVGAAASAFGPAASIGAGMAAGISTGLAQETLFPSTTEEKAIRKFDEAKWYTRNARLAGEILPSLATLRPTANARLFAKDPRAVRDFVAASALAAGVPAAFDYVLGNKFDAERFAWSIGSAAFLTPNKFGKSLFDKFARTEIAATEARNKIMADPRVTGIVSEADRAHSLARLRQYGDVSGNNVQPMMGEYLDLPSQGVLVQNQPMLSFQKALQNSTEGFRMKQRQYDNQVAAAIASENIAGHQPTAIEQPSRQFTQHEHDRLNAAAIATRDALIAQGDADAGAIIAQAHAQSQALNSARDAGILSAEGALASAQSVFTQAVADIHAARGTGGAASTQAVALLDAFKTAAYQPVEQAFNSIPTSVRTDYENTYQAARLAARPQNLGSLKKVPSLIQTIIKKYAPRFDTRGRLIRNSVPVSTVMRDLEAVTEAISVANDANEDVTVRLLGQVKDAINRDLDAIGSLEGVATARAMFRDYANKYVNGTLGAMLRSSQKLDIDLRFSKILYSKSAGQTPDQRNVTGPQQLFNALNGAGEDLVTQQLLNDMAQDGGKTAESLRNWYQNDKVQRVLNVFSNARSYLDNLIIQVEDAEALSRRATAQLEGAREVPRAVPNPAELERAENIRARANADAVAAYSTERLRLGTAAFTAFAGSDPRNAIQHIMSSDDVAGSAQQVMQLVSQDPTGQAVIGFQNAVRQFYKTQIRGSRALTGTQNAGNTLQPEQLQIIGGKVNNALVQGSPLRSIMEIVLPPNEMQALDTLRRQIQHITNPFGSITGDSQTAPMTAAKDTMEEALNSDVIGILGKLARGGNLGNKAITNKNTVIADLLQNLYYGQPDTRSAPPRNRVLAAGKRFAEEWLGLTGKTAGERAAELLVDAQLNPSTVGIEALNGDPASPRTREFIRAYIFSKDHFIQQPTVLPFNSLNTSETPLANGKIFKDGVTGYEIHNRGNKFFIYNPRGEKFATYDTLEDARQRAVTDYNKTLMNFKPKK